MTPDRGPLPMASRFCPKKNGPAMNRAVDCRAADRLTACQPIQCGAQLSLFLTANRLGRKDHLLDLTSLDHAA
jgi:hypothetical protein